jgi:nucleotide-binding universal stress UspA family protein
MNVSTMAGKIVVGVDESDGARDALRWAAREAAFRQVTVAAVLAWGFLDQPDDALAGFDPGYTEHDADAALTRMIAAALPVEEAQSVERHAICDLPARALLDASKDAEMLVVGARGLGGFVGLLVGSVSQHCVHHAAAPTVIVRGPSGGTAHDRVVVGIDGSEHAQRALVWAAEEARVRHAGLTVVHGYQLPLLGAYPYMTTSVDPTLMLDAAHELLKTSIDQIDTTGLDVTPLASPGGAAFAILDAASDADLVVVGTRGLGAVQRILVGSVATQVVHHAPGPVAVIP